MRPRSGEVETVTGRPLRSLRGTLTLAVLLASCTPEAARHGASLRFVSDESEESFGNFVFGPVSERSLELAESADLQQLLKVYVGEPDFGEEGCTPVRPEGTPATEAPQPPLLGTVQEQQGHLEFEPRFALSKERTYTACAELDALLEIEAIGEQAAADLRENQRYTARSPATRRPEEARVAVAEVWPPAGEIPANLLRIYVHFDRQMAARGVDEQVLLVRDGEPIQDAFVAIPDGLWDPEAKRLTLFLHPGRIKRGVGPHETLGPILRPGDRVTLRLNASLKAADGATLKTNHEVNYLVGDEDRALPTPAAWVIEPPTTAAAPVTVRFDELLDPGILNRWAVVEDFQGSQVLGRTQNSSGREWRFTPDTPWAPGTYRVRASSEIEDLAGNTPQRLFDRETLSAEQPKASPRIAEDRDLVLSFSVGSV